MPFPVVKVYINKKYTLYLSQEQDKTQEEVKKCDPVISQTAPMNNLTLCLLLTAIKAFSKGFGELQTQAKQERQFLFSHLIHLRDIVFKRAKHEIRI